MNGLLLNIMYSLILIMSGIVIIVTLEHFKMRVARTVFSVFFVICLIYIPFYFGGNAMVPLLSGLFKDTTIAETFALTMRATISAPFLLFKSVTVGVAVFSIISIIAGFIATVTLAITVVNYVRKRIRKASFTHRRLKCVILDDVFYKINYRFLYKRLGRYRN